ncbi:type IV pilus secretin PilQ [Thaumasiovibrio subtropicus]|nr:type IV pilus secretin PilQ [Thaumasiovibrio subtropicus]
MPNTNSVENIDFRRDKDGNGVLIAEFANPQAIVNVERRKQALQVDVLNTALPNELLYILDVNDFATVVSDVETFLLEDGARLVLSTKGDYEYDYQLNGKQLRVVMKQPPRQEVATAQSQVETVKYTGEPISINFQDIPVRNVLQLVADYNDFNLVVSDSVVGNVTLRLDGVPWEQVLDLILRVRGLDKRVEGNVVLVAPKAELEKNELEALEAQKMEEELAPLETELYSINFAKAGDIAALLAGTEDGISLLTDRGAVSTDERTNAVIVRDVPAQQEVIAKLISDLDIAIKQVQIEARIVTVDEGDLSALGVKWGFSNTNGSVAGGGSIESNIWAMPGRSIEGKDSVEMDDYLNVNLGIADPRASSIAFSVAKLGKNLLLDLELSALQAENKAEIVSSPRLMTADKKPAYIEQGVEIPYLESASSGAATIAFQKAVLSLRVVPQITPDGRLILDLEVTQDSQGDTVDTGFGKAVSINTRRIDTQVMVEDGETVVLGGIFQHAITKTTDKVPVLGDLPALGMLFRRDSENIQKREMLIFVTPQIVSQ